MTSELKSKRKSASANKTAKAKSEAADSLQAGDAAAKLKSAGGKKTASRSVVKSEAAAAKKVRPVVKSKTGNAAEVKAKVLPKAKAGSVAEVAAKSQQRLKAGETSVVKARTSPKVKTGGVAAKAGVASKAKTAGSERPKVSSPRLKADGLADDWPARKTATKAGGSSKIKAAGSVSKGGKSLKPTGRELADLVAAAAGEHKPIDPVLLDLSALSSVADWFFIASAENPRQMSAIAEKIIRRAREKGVRPLGHEGLGRGEGHWVLVDLGDVVIHIFNLEAREMYDLEGLWTDAPRCRVKV